MGTKAFVLLLLFSSATYAYDPKQVEKFKYTHECRHCDFNELNLSPEILGHNEFNESILTGTYFYGSSIENLQLENTQAREMIGLGLMLHNNQLSYADFSYSDLPNLKVTMWNQGTGTRFIGATLDEANFSYTIFDAPQFSAASMSRAVLYHVSWPYADLSGTRLRLANLTYAYLYGANLQNADLTDALLSHADFTNANLLNAVVTDEQLNKAASLCNAILPDGSLGECPLGQSLSHVD